MAKDRHVIITITIAAALLISVTSGLRSAQAGTGFPGFRKLVIDSTFRAEGVAVGDVDHDGTTG